MLVVILLIKKNRKLNNETYKGNWKCSKLGVVFNISSINLVKGFACLEKYQPFSCSAQDGFYLKELVVRALSIETTASQ